MEKIFCFWFLYGNISKYCIVYINIFYIDNIGNILYVRIFCIVYIKIFYMDNIGNILCYYDIFL